MGLAVLILGKSGSGKSASMRNFQPGEIQIFNVDGKPLPFRSNLTTIDGDDYTTILKGFYDHPAKSYVVDDAQYLMANEYMRRADESGWDKYTEIGRNFWALVNSVQKLNKNQIVYFMQHTELDANGGEKAKTIGKMIDEKITLEGMFSIVLKSTVHDGKYVFSTRNNGTDTVKTPIGMFEQDEIDNDLKAVDQTIRNYYGMKGANNNVND